MTNQLQRSQKITKLKQSEQTNDNRKVLSISDNVMGALYIQTHSVLLIALCVRY